MTNTIIRKSNFQYLRVLTLLAMLASILLAGFQARPAYAAAPGSGLVVEGVRVPGIELGFTRAQVEIAYGEPRSCQSGSVIGNMSLCKFEVEGGGFVFVHYRGADGGEASNSPDDVADNIRWTQQVSGWTTTAGVNTTLAIQNPEAVMAAYPNAEVTYNSLFGNIESIHDRSLGILIDYNFQYLSGTLTVSMVIHNPVTSPPPPPEERFMRVTAIDFTPGKKELIATVRVQDDLDRNVFKATVSATWITPRGNTESVQGVTYGFGTVEFGVKLTRKGPYTLRIDDVSHEEFLFDWDGSIASATYMK